MYQLLSNEIFLMQRLELKLMMNSFILSDGDEIEFGETKNDESRTLFFSLSAGNEEIEIIGTILANNSFLMEQQQKEVVMQAEADAIAQAEADTIAQAEADAIAQAEADAIAQAEADAKLNEEQKVEKLMNACGDGTIFENGACVLSPMEKNAKNVNPGPLIYSIVIGLMIGIIITLILWELEREVIKFYLMVHDQLILGYME